MRKISGIIGIVALLVSLGVTTEFYVSGKSLKLEINQSRMVIKKLQEDVENLNGEKEKVTGENEKLRDDLTAYLGVEEKAKADKEKLSTFLTKAQKTIEEKEANIQLLNRKLEELKNEHDVLKAEFQTDGKEKEKRLLEKISSIEAVLNQERAVFNYNLAVAYEKAGLDDEAVEAYEKSLRIDAKNADAYYNLGLIYKDKLYDPENAVKYFNLYLEFSTNADDKAEVEGWIKGLEE